MSTKKDIGLHLVVEKLKLLRLLHLVAIEVLKVLFIWNILHAKENIVPLGIKPAEVITFKL